MAKLFKPKIPVMGGKKELMLIKKKSKKVNKTSPARTGPISRANYILNMK